MKNLKERKLAVEMMKRRLGFAPRLEDIIPLESDHYYGKCTYVMFRVKGDKMGFTYRAYSNYGAERELVID